MPAAAEGDSEATASSCWGADNMSVRFLDWNESMHLSAESIEALSTDLKGLAVGTSGEHNTEEATSTTAGTAADARPPGVPLQEQYDVIIGTDIMYEMPHATLVPAVIEHRLEKSGMCLICCAVREQAMFDAFSNQCASRGLRYRILKTLPVSGYSGILGRHGDYEGGFLLIAIDHQAAPCNRWHRDDFTAA